MEKCSSYNLQLFLLKAIRLMTKRSWVLILAVEIIHVDHGLIITGQE